jgi:hypothetical protein
LNKYYPSQGFARRQKAKGKRQKAKFMHFYTPLAEKKCSESEKAATQSIFFHFALPPISIQG